MSRRRLFHYTSMWHMPAILKSGYLALTEPNLSWREATTAPQVLWLIDRDFIEARTNGLDGSIVDKTEVRIEVPARGAIRWLDLVHEHPHDHEFVQTIIRSGGGLKAARRWWVHRRPIPMAEWIDVAERQPDGTYLSMKDAMGQTLQEAQS